jgi:hypothetical protein
MKVLTALIAGQPSGTSSDEWSTISITGQAPIQDTAIIALDVAKERAADLHSRAMWSLIVQLCSMACAIAGVTAICGWCRSASATRCISSAPPCESLRAAISM